MFASALFLLVKIFGAREQARHSNSGYWAVESTVSQGKSLAFRRRNEMRGWKISWRSHLRSVTGDAIHVRPDTL